MKRRWICVLLVLAIISLVACQPAGTNNPGKAKLVEKDGLLTDLDTSGKPFEGGGVRTAVDRAQGTVTFTKTDAAGKDTVEYLKFTPAKQEVEKYTFVSMMGTGFYYIYDLKADALVRIENKDHQDQTESSKKSGRFDTAAKNTKADVDSLQAYFQERFGQSIADAVKK